MAFNTVNAVLLAIAFLVPGFILSAILATVFRRRSLSASERTLQYLTFSCLNHGFWSWLIVAMIQGQWLYLYPIPTALLVFVILFLSPVLLGLLALWLAQREWARMAVSAFGFEIVRFVPTAWDFKFQQEIPAWIIVRLNDGSTVSGFFGNQSFAGDDPEERDLYIEAVFELNEDGQWKPVVDTGGILIKANQIATIEFRNLND